MKRYYTTGQFAKLANITERTVRYYDKVGLLKPSFVMENGYRKYCHEDLIKLQKILLFKTLGFSLEEIEGMIVQNNNSSMSKSLQTQIELVDSKMQYYAKLKDSLISARNLVEENRFNDSKIIELLQLNSNEERIIKNYQNAVNLKIRIKLHELYSQNKQGWFPWLYKQIDFNKVNKLLEIGCGDGNLWENNELNMRNREIFLSDISEGMLNAARKKLGEEFSYMVIDCQHIPFKKEYFDAVIANHVLFYVHDMDKGLREINRVLKAQGIFYCSTYGNKHMQEITQLVKEFDSEITLSNHVLFEKFGLENGKMILSEFFHDIELYKYDDELIVDDYKPLFDYIISCHGNQTERLQGKMNEFQLFLEKKVSDSGLIKVTKQAGVFVCKNKIPNP